MPPILSQIIRLIKSISLRAPDPPQRPSSQFIAGKHPPFGFPTGVGLNWWYSADTFFTQEILTTLIIHSSLEFHDCDQKTVSEVVRNTLHEICIDQAIFNTDDVIFARKSTLFECICVPVPQCASAIFNAILDNLRASIGRCCTIYAVTRFRPESFWLEDANLHLINKADRVAWQRLIESGFVFDGWTPDDPRPGLRRDAIYSPNGNYESILVADSHGTKEGTRFSSVLKFRSFLAVMFAIASDRSTYPYWKSAADPLGFCVQFPHESNPDRTMNRNDCGALVPYYADDILISSDHVLAIRKGNS